MNQILYEERCRCKKSSITKKRFNLSEGRTLQYPNWDERDSEIFQIKYQKKLSVTAKFLLNSFQNKYIYYAIDDILYTFKSNPIEQDNLLTILYSPILSLQNNFSINFFDIWIDFISIDEISKPNKFLNHDSQTSEQFSYITIKLLYKIPVPVKKQKLLW